MLPGLCLQQTLIQPQSSRLKLPKLCFLQVLLEGPNRYLLAVDTPLAGALPLILYGSCWPILWPVLPKE